MGETVGTVCWCTLLEIFGRRLSRFIAPKGCKAVLARLAVSEFELSDGCRADEAGIVELDQRTGGCAGGTSQLFGQNSGRERNLAVVRAVIASCEMEVGCTRYDRQRKPSRCLEHVLENLNEGLCASALLSASGGAAAWRALPN